MGAPTKINNIQLLRGFAAVAVVFLHTKFALPHARAIGSFGVDVFFVISGYIMARILENNSAFFLRRRLMRIVPPYWILTLILYVVGLHNPELFHTTRVGISPLIKSLFFVPFEKPLLNGGHLIEPLLGPGWTLEMEIVFYLALSLGLVISPKRSVLLGGGILVGLFIVCRSMIHVSAIAEFFGRSVMLEFIFGLLAYYFCSALSAKASRRIRVPVLFLAVLSAVLLVVLEGFLSPAALNALPQVLLFGVPAWVLVTSAVILSQAQWDTTLAILILIGDSSYMLYLINFFTIFGIDRIAARYCSWLHTTTVPGAVVAVTTTLVSGVALHRFLEVPLLRFLMVNYGGKRPPTEDAALPS